MIQYIDTADSYEPGVCNIGPAEIRRRRQFGFAGLAGAVVLGVVLLGIDAPAWARLAMAIPVAVSLEGFIQARLRFCAGFAMAGVQNMGDIGNEVAVDDRAALAADRRKALGIHAIALAGGIVAGLGFALLPV